MKSNLLPCLFSCALLAAQSPRPILDLTQTRHDFGRISSEQPVTVTFPVGNRGTAPLHLQDISTSCGCTSALPDKSVLAPGESVGLVVRFDPARQNGEVERSIWVLTDDPARPRALFTLRADIFPPVYLEPRVVYFRAVLASETPVQTLRCRGFAGQPVRFQGFKPLPPYLRAEASQDGKEIAVRVTLLPALVPAGQRSGQERVVLLSDDPDAPEAAVPVYWDLGRAILADPGRLVFPQAAAGTGLQLPLCLRQARNRPFRILAWELLDCLTTPAPFQVQALPTGAAPVQTLQVRVPAGTPAGLQTGTLHLTTDDPDQRELRIELAAMLTGRP